MQLDRAGWLRALRIAEAEVPHLVVVECSWWREERVALVRRTLDDVRETGLPDIWLGRWQGEHVLYSCGWGSPRLVEPVHMAGELGTPAVIGLGCCGGLQPGVRIGDVVLPRSATIGEGTSQYYGGHGTSTGDPSLIDAAEAAIDKRGLRSHSGRLVTTSSQLARPRPLVQSWYGAGHVAVDMATSAVFSAATYYGMRAASLLTVSEEVMIDRSLLSEDTGPEFAAVSDTGATLLEVALEIGFTEGE